MAIPVTNDLEFLGGSALIRGRAEVLGADPSELFAGRFWMVSGVLSYYDGTKIVRCTGGGGGATRAIRNLTASVDHGSVALGSTYMVLAVAVSAPGRLRIYTTDAERLADLFRPSYTPALAGTGVVADLVFSTEQLTARCSPLASAIADASGGISTPAVWQWDGATGTTIAITYLPLEQ